MIHIGIDPGAVGAAVAMDDADGSVVAAVHWNERRAWLLDDDGACWSLMEPGMVGALRWFAASVCGVAMGERVQLVVEAVTVNRGKGSPIALATAAGVAIGVVSAVCRVGSLHRPRPEGWRKVVTGKALQGRRGDLKAAAQAWASGRLHPGLDGMVLHPGGRVLPDGPDHPAEAALMAWASVRGVV